MVDIREKLDALYSIKSVRETNAHTKNLLERNELTNFNVDKSKLDSTAEFVIQTIRESFPTNETLLSIPIHGRYQQFESDGKKRLTNIIETEFKNLNDLEICKKLVDLFMVSVCWMPVLEMYGNIKRWMGQHSQDLKDWQLPAFICLQMDCSVMIRRIHL